MSVFSTMGGVRGAAPWVVAAALLAGPLAGSGHGDELWRQAKAYTAAVKNIHAQAVQALEDAQDALASAEEDLAEAQADLEQARDETSSEIAAEIADEAAEAVAAARFAVQLAEAGLKVAEALADVASAGTAIGQGADYLISYCWDPVCPLETFTGTYAYPTDVDTDAMARLVIQGALGNTLSEADVAEVDALRPGAGTASWAYMRSVTRSFSIALRGAGAYTAGNCPDLLAARTDLQAELGTLAGSIGPFAGFLEAETTYWSEGDLSGVLDSAALALLAVLAHLPEYPDQVMVEEAVNRALLALVAVRTELEPLSLGQGGPQNETFDGYPTGAGIHGRDGWTAWNDDPTVDATLTDALCRSDYNALDVQVAADVVYAYPPVEAGQWSFTAWQYIPSEYASGGPMPDVSTLILLNDYDPGAGHSPSDMSVSYNFDSNDGMLKVYYGNGMNTAERPYVPDEWVELQVVVDLDLDWTQVYYDGELLAAYAWTGGILGDGLGEGRISAVELRANGSSSILYDDMRLRPVGGPLVPQPLLDEHGVLPPLTVEDFLQFLADCALYDEGALPPIEVEAVNVLMPLNQGTYDSSPYLGPAIAAWDALGDTGFEAALFGPDGVLSFGEVLTTAVDNHWTLIDLAQSPLVQDCLPPCPADTDGSGSVDVDDLVNVILDWGSDGSAHNTDVDGNGTVNVDDLVEVILAWGPCS